MLKMSFSPLSYINCFLFWSMKRNFIKLERQKTGERGGDQGRISWGRRSNPKLQVKRKEYKKKDKAILPKITSTVTSYYRETYFLSMIHMYRNSSRYGSLFIFIGSLSLCCSSFYFKLHVKLFGWKSFSCRFPFLVDPNTGTSMYESGKDWSFICIQASILLCT